jgi:signal transduction histidine kinase
LAQTSGALSHGLLFLTGRAPASLRLVPCDGTVGFVAGLPEDVEGLFRTFMDHSPLTAWIVDEEDRLVYSSEPFPLRDDQVGMSMWDMVPVPYVQPYREALHRARSTGQTQVVTAPGPVAGGAPGDEGWYQAHYFSLPRRWVGGVGIDVTSLTEAQKELERSRQRLVAAGDQARRRIERDLHDGVQQRLIVQLLRLRAVQQRAQKDPTAAATMLDATIGDLEEAIEELRELARGIHPSSLTRSGLGPALSGLAARAGLPVRLRCSVEGRLPEAVEVATYFVCSESLTNMAKHARATTAEVSVHVAANAVEAVITDDGVGGVVVERGGGLEGLRDRVQALGGSFEISSRVGAGTTLRVSIPLNGSPGSNARA